jgi:hypothetical protein
VEISGDAAPLVVRRLDGAHEKHLAVELTPAQPPCETPGEGHLYEPEEHKAREQERREREPDPAPGGRDRRPPLVRLEEQRRPVGRPDREVDLVEAALTLLEAVLGPAEVTALGARPARAQHLELRVVERIPRPDQPRLVGVDDASVGGPDLNAHDSLTEHAFLDDRVEMAECCLITVDHAGAKSRLDDALPREGRVLSRVPKRLALADAPEDEEPADEEHGQHEQARQRELRDGARHRRCARGRDSRGGSRLLQRISFVGHAALSIAGHRSDGDGVRPMSHCGPDAPLGTLHHVNARVERRRR